MTEISPFRRRVIEDMTVRNLSPATEQCTSARNEVCRYFGRSPDSAGREDVHAFLVHLASSGLGAGLNETFRRNGFSSK